MNFVLHNHKTPSAMVKIPTNLRELMADIAREVLREQPEDVVTFIADYVNALLITRESTTVAKHTVESLLDCTLNVLSFMESKGVDRERAEKSAALIQSSFRQHTERLKSAYPDKVPFEEEVVLVRLINECNFTLDEALKASTVIQNAYNNYFHRHKGYEFQTTYAVSWKHGVESTLHSMLIKPIYKVQHQKLNQLREKYAFVIQGAFKGYLARKETKEMKSAITKIQTLYKAFKIRKHMEPEEDLKKVKPPVDEATEKAQAEAVTLIASVFRSHQTRQKLEEDGIDLFMDNLDIGNKDTNFQSRARLTASKSHLLLTTQAMTEEEVVEIETEEGGEIDEKSVFIQEKIEDQVD